MAVEHVQLLAVGAVIESDGFVAACGKDEEVFGGDYGAVLALFSLLDGLQTHLFFELALEQIAGSHELTFFVLDKQ